MDGKPISAVGCAVNINTVKEMEKKFQEELAYSNATQSDNLIAKVRSNVTKNVIESYIANEEVSVTNSNTSYEIGAEQLATTGFTTREQEMIRDYLNRERVLRAFSQGEFIYSIDYRRKTKSGNVIWVNTMVKTYQNPDSGDIMSFMYSYDITEDRIKDRIIETVTALEYDFIVYIDLNLNKYKLYSGKKDRIPQPLAQAGDYVEIMNEVNKVALAPEEVDKANSDMSPENIRNNLKKQRVF